ncbi:MAG: hypothetical protein JXR94_08045, partial [Candidatus Hydrogenedentes bacterium]|nr:hypothetical protein [Candidatus Hydrogenedentota bacterium]
TPRFDAYDNVYGRSRVESKIDNLVFGRDTDTGEAWQVMRLTLYQGNDVWNEFRTADDYEIELDLRPRAWWGFQIAGEHHSIGRDVDIDDPFYFEGALLEAYEDATGRPFDPEVAYRYNAQYGDYDRLLTYLYYNDLASESRLNGRIGFAYTATQGAVFNREILYGLGYRLGEKWALAFEHRYDLERSELYRQQYEVRRVFHCLESAFMVRERGSGWDFSIEVGVTALPGTKLKF